MAIQDVNAVALAMSMIQEEFKKTDDLEKTQWLLLKKFSTLYQNGGFDNETYTTLYWYTCGYRDGYEKGGDIE